MEINKLITYTMLFIVVSLIFGFGAVFLGNLKDKTYIEVENQINDELLGVVDVLPKTFYTLNTPIKIGSDVVYVKNTTSLTTSTLTRDIDYTINYDTGEIIISNSPLGTGTDIEAYIDYIYLTQESTQATQTIDSGISGLTTIPSFLTIIALVLVIGILLSYLIKYIMEKFDLV